MKTRPLLLKLALTTLLLISVACSGQRLDPDLQQAVNAARYMTSERFLSRSSFRYLFPEAKPSQFVGYIFSDLGVAEWPLALDEMEQQQLRSAGIPALPATVALVARRPDPGLGKQVVLRADDAADRIIIEAYQDPKTPPRLSIERNINQKNQ